MDLNTPNFFFSICFIKHDVTVKEEWNEVWDWAEKQLEGHIDLLLNNAGINPVVRTLLSSSSLHATEFILYCFSLDGRKILM